jgi:hypothetical protein
MQRRLRKLEEERVQLDESVEKKDLVAGPDGRFVTLPKLPAPPDQVQTCVPFTEARFKPIDAFYCSRDGQLLHGSRKVADRMFALLRRLRW